MTSQQPITIKFNNTYVFDKVAPRLSLRILFGPTYVSLPRILYYRTLENPPLNLSQFLQLLNLSLQATNKKDICSIISSHLDLMKH